MKRINMLQLIHFTFLIIIVKVNAHWSDDGPVGNGLGKLSALDVICGKDHMTVRAEFAGPFHGVVASKGTYGQDNCVYIKPYSGVTHATFKVYYDQCGTKPDLQGKYYENTVVIQYGTDIIEAWDEAKRLRCEWFEAYEKPATFRPAIPVADLDVVEMNFQGDDIDCWMEIQEGKGPWGREVSRIVPVGQPMTIVIAINDYGGEFDMRVKSCFAHDGVKPAIHLTDEHGCVLRPKMLTKFEKVKDPNGKATVISYSHFYAFKFPDSMNVQIQCTVEVCRHGCPDACSTTPSKHQPDRQFKQQISLSYDQRSPSSTVQSSSNHHIHHQSSKTNEIINNQPNESQDSYGLASSNLPSLTASSPPTPPQSQSVSSSPPTVSSDHHGLSKDFDSKRLSVYTNEERKDFVNGSLTENNQSNDSTDDSSPNTASDNSSDSDEANDQNDEDESKVTKESDYQASSSINNEKIVVPQTPHHPPPSLMEPISENEEDKPVFISDKDSKESLFSKLSGDSYDKAAELFKDLGVNVDIAKFASGFIHGIESNGNNNNNQQNLGSLLENNKVREMVESSGLNLKESNHLTPQVQPLISKPMKEIDSDNNDEEDQANPEESSVNSEHLTSPAPTSSYPNSLLNNIKETGQQQKQTNDQQQPNERSNEASTPVGTKSQVYQNDQEKGQLSEINNIISNQQSSSSIGSLKPPDSIIKINQNNDENVRPDEMKLDQNTNLDLELPPSSSSSSSKGINLPYKNPQPEALTGLNVENPVAQVVPLQLGIGPINNFVPPKFNNLMPSQPQVAQYLPHLPLIRHQQTNQQHHHQQQQPKQKPHQLLHPHLHLNLQQTDNKHQRPMFIHEGIKMRPQQGQTHQQPQINQRPPLRQPSLPLHRAASLLSNFAGLSNLNIPFLSTIQGQDNQRNVKHQYLPSGPILPPSSVFPHGPRSFRSKRSPSSEPIVSVKKGFQVVTSIDLDFNPNSTDLPEIYEGRREEIIYGVCVPFNGLIVSLVITISIIFFALISSFVLVRKINKSRRNLVQFDN